MISLRRYKKFFASLFVPVLFSPLLFIGQNNAEAKMLKCGYTIIIMGLFWMFEILPLAITALFPVVLFPFLNIQSTGEVVSNYMKETQMMFIGGISLALALQYSNLHKRLSLKIMILIGCSPWRLLFGILLVSLLLSSVVVVNTAVSAMLVPIVQALIESLDEKGFGRGKKELRVLFMLAVGYGANIGGASTYIGSQPNLIFKEIIEKEDIDQGGKYLGLNFFTFFAYSMPIALLNIFIVWLILGMMFLGVPKNIFRKKIEQFDLDVTSTQSDEDAVLKMTKSLKNKYSDLGPMNFHEIAVLILLSLGIVLWLTRDPQIFTGWLKIFPKDQLKIGDSSVAIALVIIMFIIPKRFSAQIDDNKKDKTLLSWNYIQRNFPWNVILIVGGGLAISDGANVSGLSKWLGNELTNIVENLPKSLLLFIILVIISVFTEFMSNAATISLITPILIALSKKLDYHPLYLSLPGGIACQYAFMLPTSNPPNAIVFNAGEMKIKDMAKVGLILNFTCILVLFLMNISWGEFVIFNYRDYKYANSNISIPTHFIV